MLGQLSVRDWGEGGYWLRVLVLLALRDGEGWIGLGGGGGGEIVGPTGCERWGGGGGVLVGGAGPLVGTGLVGRREYGERRPREGGRREGFVVPLVWPVIEEAFRKHGEKINEPFDLSV